MRERDAADQSRRVLMASELSHTVIGAVEVLSHTSTSARVLVLAKTERSSGETASSVEELEVTEAGFTHIRTRFAADLHLFALAVTASRVVLAAGDGGLVITQRPGEAEVRYSLGAGLRLLAIETFGGSEDRHYLGGGLGLVGEGNLLEGPSGVGLGVLERDGHILDSSVIDFRRRPAESGEEIWALTPGQGVFRRAASGEWFAVDLEAPLGLEACASPPNSCGRGRLLNNMEGLEFDEAGRMFYATARCSTFFTRASGDLCTQHVVLDGPPQTAADGLLATARLENRLYFVRDRELWVLEL